MEKKKQQNTSLQDRNKAYKKTYNSTHDHRAAVRAYCAGNKWLEENARAVGNW